MGQFSQSTPEVLAGLDRVTGHHDQAQQHVQSALDIGVNMTAGPWLGESSKRYATLFQQIHDEFQHHINQGRQDVETTKGIVNTQGNHDQDL
jgi:hypothetical protein